MESGHENQPVITLNDESFKQYLIARYGRTFENPNWQKLKNASQDLVSGDTWVQLYNRAKDDLAQRGGSLMGYELINNVLLSHDGVNASWPMNWMWVIRFGRD